MKWKIILIITGIFVVLIGGIMLYKPETFRNIPILSSFLPSIQKQQVETGIFYEDCSSGAITDQWVVGGTWYFGSGGNSGWCITDKNTASDNMTSIPIDLSDANFQYANLTFDYLLNGFDSGTTDRFRVWVNTSSTNWVMIYSDDGTVGSGTGITINLSQFITVNSKTRLRVSCNDNQNAEYCQIDNINVSKITKETDTTQPKWYSNSTNSTKAGTLVNHSVIWSDNIALSGYIFSFDNGTGTFTNDSWNIFPTTNNSFSNVLKVANSTEGSVIRWIVYANDSLDNWNNTRTFTYTTTLPHVLLSMIYPTTSINVTQNHFFNVTLNMTCAIEDCGKINVTLDPWDISEAVNTANLSVIGQSGLMKGIFINSSGTGMYLLGSNKIFQYYLSTPWDITTAVNTVNSSVIPDSSVDTNVFINSSGTGLYVGGTINDKIYQYYLSTPWDVSSMVNTENYSIGAIDPNVKGLIINSSGIGMYTIGTGFSKISGFYLSTPWSVSTATNTQNSSSLLGKDTNQQGLFIDSSGTRLYWVGATNDKVYQYELTTAWDLSTMSFIRDLSLPEPTVTDIFINSSGEGMYIIGDGNDKVYQYDLPPLSPTKSGTIPVQADWTQGDFFYTNASQNPNTTISLSEGQSQLMNFWVNATGNPSTGHLFFAYANLTSDTSISNITTPDIVINISEAPADTCTYSGSGKWNIQASDLCVISVATHGDGSDIDCEGTGTLTINANIDGFNDFIKANTCEVRKLNTATVTLKN